MLDPDPLVCSCLAVAESEVLHAIRRGADSVDAVGRACEAGTCCQSCHEGIRSLLQEDACRELARSRSPQSLRQLSLFDNVIDERGQRRGSAPMGSHKR